MAIARVVAIILVVVGLIFVGQGLGFIPGSFMTGDRFWAVVGAVAIVAGAALGYRAFRAP